jgi:hypothetical protein
VAPCFSHFSLPARQFAALLEGGTHSINAVDWELPKVWRCGTGQGMTGRVFGWLGIKDGVVFRLAGGRNRRSSMLIMRTLKTVAVTLALTMPTSAFAATAREHLGDG